MRGRPNAIDEILSPFLNHFHKENFVRNEVAEKPPLRSELFSTEQMEQHAHHLASSHQLSESAGPELLLKSLAENEKILFEVAGLLHDAIREKKAITPAGEWLLDNFYLIEEQIAIGKRYLPKGYSKGLPRITNGISAGFPRVYDIAIQIISHSDGRIDLHILNSFISAYQKIKFLTIGELWAVPIMLRLALIENLSRVAARIAVDRNDADLAAEWGDKVISTAEEKPKDLVLVIADMARSNPPMVSAFVAEFTRKLQWKGLDLNLPLTWIEQHLAESSSTISLMVLSENSKQAADQLSMSNSINSLRFLAKMDWREFVELSSIVEQTLHQDIDGIYGQMDFYTRDNYRHAIEKIAKHGSISEFEVAKLALEQARQSAQTNPQDKRRSHVGFYLLGEGLKTTEKLSKVKRSAFQNINKFFCDHVRSSYVIMVLLSALAIAIGLTLKVYNDDVPRPLFIAVAILAALAASHLAIALVNWGATLLVRPKPLPKLDFSSGIPALYRTLVVVPTIIGNKQQAQKIVDDLEVRYLGNRDPNLLFALLTDFKDAAQESLPEDEEVLNTVLQRIQLLNKKYKHPEHEPFFLFHRPRRWNAQEKKWMGYERKRGKLTELNDVLRGNGRDRFSIITGSDHVLTSTKYVITLDTDTQLPRDAGARLAGLMAHPLNQPYYNPKKRRVTEGYGIIQPRIAISLHGAKFSRYTRMHENDSGIDPYTRITSDVYQDIFEEGSFIGKGIYDVDAFAQSLNNRFPENRILSHDLLEGSYARCGFASDIQLYEEYPSRYGSDVARRHRWIRGDWQIGSWFLPFVPGADKRLHTNPVSVLSRWKIFDNLRRSVIPIALLALIVIAWIFLADVWFWTLCLTSIIVLPPLLMSAWHAARKPQEIARRQHLSNVLDATYKNLQQAFFMLVCLPYEAFYSVDAIVKTLWRMYISRKNLLEWNPSGFADQSNESLGSSYASMWFPPVASIALLGYLITYHPANLVLAIPILAVWLFSPLLIWWLGKPLPSSRTQINAEQRLYLRELAQENMGLL